MRVRTASHHTNAVRYYIKRHQDINLFGVSAVDGSIDIGYTLSLSGSDGDEVLTDMAVGQFTFEDPTDGDWTDVILAGTCACVYVYTH